MNHFPENIHFKAFCIGHSFTLWRDSLSLNDQDESRHLEFLSCKVTLQPLRESRCRFYVPLISSTWLIEKFLSGVLTKT